MHKKMTITGTYHYITFKNAAEILDISKKQLLTFLKNGDLKENHGYIELRELSAFKVKLNFDREKVLDELVEISQKLRLYE